MKRMCKFCGEDLAAVPPTEAITRHIVGLCTASKREVDAALNEIASAEDQQEKALRAHYAREHVPMQVPRLRLLQWAVILILVGAAIAFFASWRLE